MNLIIIVSVVLLTIAIMAMIKSHMNKRPADSVLRQRAVLNSQAQLTISRLKEILVGSTVLAQVSFDALLTTKYSHTRNKYKSMVADFVILNQDYQVVAIVAVDDANPSIKRIKQDRYQDELLQMAGYRVYRYRGVPDHQQLRMDFHSKSEVDHHFTDYAVQAPTNMKAYQTDASLLLNS